MHGHCEKCYEGLDELTEEPTC